MTASRSDIVRVGVDGGGTATRAVVVDGTWRVLGRGEAASSNLYAVGQERAVSQIFAAVVAALERAGAARHEIGAWGFGLAGARTATEQATLAEALKALTREAPAVVDEDAAAAWAGAFADDGGRPQPGAILVAGTGVNCFGVGANGRRARADGWGPLLGDRGSGYWIGEAALRAAGAEADAGNTGGLLEGVLAHFGIASFDDLVPVAYAPDFSRAQVAALFPLIVTLARAGNNAAAALLRQAGVALGASAAVVMERLEVEKLALFGGVLENSDEVRQALARELEGLYPGRTLVPPRFDAAIGAAVLAQLVPFGIAAA